MSLRILQTFEADVYGTIVTSPILYNTIGALHRAMLENRHDTFFGHAQDEHNTPYRTEKLDMPSFMHDLIFAVEIYWLNTSYFALPNLESEIIACISNCENFQDLRLTIFGDDRYFDVINEKIKNGSYSIKG